jgi:ribose 5-phosphate isomerase B
MTNKIVIGADHAGFVLKQAILSYWRESNIDIVDVGTNSKDSVDYPYFAEQACYRIQSGEADFGLLICGSGIGMAIAANRLKGIRAVWADRPEIAAQARKHNNANVLCLGQMYVNGEQWLPIWLAFQNIPFEGAERHVRRIKMIDSFQKK